MSSDLFDVARVVPTELVVEGEVPLTAVFRYRISDPYAVSVLFRSGDLQIEWTFARELLLDGLTFSTGIGDVLIGPGTDGRIQLILRSPDGTAKMLCEREGLQEFVDKTYSLVPAGSESIDLAVDQVLAELAL